MGTFWQNLIKKSLKFGHLGHFFLPKNEEISYFFVRCCQKKRKKIESAPITMAF